MRARMSANDHRYTNDRANVMDIIFSPRYIYTTSRQIFMHFTTDTLPFANILLKESLDFMSPGGNNY